MKARKENGGETREWREHFEWIDPSRVFVDGNELQWTTLTQEDARQSFQVLERMRPFLDGADVQDGASVLRCREQIASQRDGNGAALFGERDLRFFDLYFGGDHIRVERTESGYDITNGRHRLWLAQQESIKSLPVAVNELSEKEPLRAAKETDMSKLELDDVENEAREQHDEAERMKTEINEHREQVGRLEEAVKVLRASGQEIGSEEQRSAEAAAEKGRQEVERRLKEIKHDRDEMLLTNKELGGKILKVLDGRRQAQNKVSMILATGASGEFRSQMDEMNASLGKDLASLAHAEAELEDARKRLESLDL
jgi:hypothetical protein